ncbi:unnamed protein product [Phytophthora fragariaefolia]|uniref:Unnamed protein product n=1 Tax=Phytophthora fragariaefolia TaxID=1490495 RepID=A0A9W7D623_9STRA|nr:unnamed protein product [Phytophthora fragariaefolia]
MRRCARRELRGIAKVYQKRSGGACDYAGDGVEGEAHGEAKISSSVRLAEADNDDPEGGSSTEEDDDQGVNERGDGREHTSVPDARHGVNEDPHQFSVNERNQHNDEDHSSQHSALEPSTNSSNCPALKINTHFHCPNQQEEEVDDR